MTKIIMLGCNGRMGQMITDMVKQDDECTIVAGIDIVDNRDNGYPVYTKLADCDVEADAIIDFTSATDLRVVWIMRWTSRSQSSNVRPDYLRSRWII